MTLLRNIFKPLVSPSARVRALRRDDSAQVMILTGVMIFILMIFTISILNTSTGIYNKMRSQNAVDAAADAYAIWQARGLNVAQHVNDIHWALNVAYFTAETIACASRIVCPFLKAIPYVGPGLEAACCSITAGVVIGVELAQAVTQPAAHQFQEIVNVAAPVIGVIVAQQVAEANGADPILEVAGDVIDSILGLFGIDAPIGDFMEGLSDIPLIGDIASAIYALPLDLDPNDLFSLNIKQKEDPLIPPWLMPEELIDVCKNIPCSGLSITCFSGSVTDDNEAEATPDTIDEVGSDCGWDDTYYYGYPGYNTWVAGKGAINIIRGYEKIAWLNPQRHQEVDDSRFVQSTHSVSGEDEFMNSPNIALASSQPWGHENPKKQPVVERSMLVDDFTWQQAHLISVHFGWDEGEEPDSASTYLIWH